MNALVVYFFWRWEQLKELFLLFKDYKLWYNIRILVCKFNFWIYYVLVSF